MIATLLRVELDQPEARSRGAGADVPAADPVLLDLRVGVRQPGNALDLADPHRRRRRGRQRVEPPHRRGPAEGEARCARATTEGCRKAAGPRSIARPPRRWCRTATCRSRWCCRKAWATRRAAFGGAENAPHDPAAGRRLGSDRAADGRRPAAEGDDDGGARPDDAGRHEAVREVRRGADAAAALGGRRVAAAAEAGRRPAQARPAPRAAACRRRRRHASTSCAQGNAESSWSRSTRPASA